MARDLQLDDVDVMTAVSVVIDWYESQRVEDVIDGSGDMLLFQWGTYDWGAGPAFEFDLTRQFIVVDVPDDDDAIWQLHLTFRFAPDAALGEDAKWCESPAAAPAFRRWITSHPISGLVELLTPERTEVVFEQAG